MLDKKQKPTTAKFVHKIIPCNGEEVKEVVFDESTVGLLFKGKFISYDFINFIKNNF